MSFTSDELNYLIYRYMKESGFEHSAFVFASESRVNKVDLNTSDVLPGALVYTVQKGLQFMEVEATLNEDGTEGELEEPISLLAPHKALKRSGASKKSKKRAHDDAVGEDPMEVDDRTKVAKTKASSSVRVSTSIAPSKSSVLEGHTSEVFCCSWNPTQNLLASGSGDSTARIWKVGTLASSRKNGEEISKSPVMLNHVRDGDQDSGSKDVTTLDWNSDGSRLATGCYDGVARIWDPEGHLLKELSHHTGPIFSLRWSKSGQHLLSGSVDATAIVWDASTGTVKQQFKHHTAPTLDVDWCSDTRFASCSSDNKIHVCELGQNAPLKTFTGHDNEVNAIRWDPTGTMLASCSDDSTTKVWRLDSDAPAHNFAEHEKEIYTIRWNPKHPMIASASFDTTVRLWDVNSGTCVHKLVKHEEPVYSVAFSPDGNYIASGSFDKNLHIWSVKEGKHVKTYKGGGGIFEVCWNAAGDKVAACFSNNSVVIVDFRI